MTQGELLVEYGGYVAGVGAVAKGSTRLASKQIDKFSGQRTAGGKAIVFDGKFYSVDRLKFSKNYYDRLWRQGRPAPFVQAKEVLGSNPKIMPDPKGAPGYFKYEGAGLEMIYNPTTGQVGHIQPIKIKWGPMDFWPILEDELERYRVCVSSIRQYLMKYESLCSELILRIGSKEFDDSQSDFDELFDIQDKLATVKYKYEFQLSKRLQDFVYHMDRDDLYSRKFWHKKFQAGQLWPEE
ncbi:hypothetical protein [Yersinia rochesterensis]|uniref:hypothetical protein n=1 Tax=Yersinia rochesterensis TaxID=1604335 RepID=UPI001F30248E|nr:hypothetical protein [Yersinia rochesterensis]